MGIVIASTSQGIRLIKYLVELPARGEGLTNFNYYLFVFIAFCLEYKLLVHYPGNKLNAIQVNGGWQENTKK